jgi:hypothetical protein
LECVVNVKQLQIEQGDVTAIIQTFDGRTVTPEPENPDAPIKRIEIRLKRGDRVDIPIKVFKRLGTSVSRYVPPVPTIDELEALEAAAAIPAGPPDTKAKGAK